MYTVETVSKMTVKEASQLGVQRFRDGFTFANYNVRPTGFVTACFKANRTDLLKALDHGCNMFRHAEHDGLRVIAWLAKYLEQGQDPLKEIVKMVVDRGYDVNPSDVAWAEEEEEEE